MLKIKKIMDLPEESTLDEVANLFVTKWYKKPWRWVKRQFENIARLLKWLSIIWKDREWDNAYLEDILIFKLKNMRDYYRAGINVWSEGFEKTADEIDEVIEILERVREDNYEEIVDPDFNAWMDMEEPFFKESVNEKGETVHSFDVPDWTEQERQYRREVYEEAERLLQEDLSEAYGLIAKNIRNWWD